MGTNTRSTGRHGEQLVADFLTRQGYTILTRNISWRGGEIDLVAERGEVIAFVEVKLRKNSYLHVADLVPPVKQRKILRTSVYFRTTHKLSARSYRFDVALVDTGAVDQTGNPTITYYEHAFTGYPNDIW